MNIVFSVVFSSNFSRNFWIYFVLFYFHLKTTVRTQWLCMRDCVVSFSVVSSAVVSGWCCYLIHNSNQNMGIFPLNSFTYFFMRSASVRTEKRWMFLVVVVSVVVTICDLQSSSWWLYKSVRSNVNLQNTSYKLRWELDTVNSLPSVAYEELSAIIIIPGRLHRINEHIHTHTRIKI